MVGLLDLAPSTATVAVDGESVSVNGVSAKGIAALLRQFPAMADAFSGGKAVTLDAASIMDVAPDAIAAIIAAGTGYPGNPEAIARAEQLPAGVQLEFLNAILGLTMPEGIAPFMEALNGVISRLDFGDRTKA